MGVYSSMRSDADILREITGLKSVVIVSCSSCANTSVAYDKDLPVNRIITNKETGRVQTVPVAIVEEAKRLKTLFENNGITTTCEIFSAPCVISDDVVVDQAELLKHCNEADAVVTLFCPSGIMGLMKLIRKETKIVPGMKTQGLWQRYTYTDAATGLMYIDRARFAIIRNMNR